MKSGKRYLFLLVAFFFLAASGWPGQKAGIRQPETAEAVCEVEERENCGETGDRSETSDDKREAEVQELPPQVATTFDDVAQNIYAVAFRRFEGAGSEGDLFSHRGKYFR